jgi:hypothetical protein
LVNGYEAVDQSLLAMRVLMATRGAQPASTFVALASGRLNALSLAEPLVRPKVKDSAGAQALDRLRGQIGFETVDG